MSVLRFAFLLVLSLSLPFEFAWADTDPFIVAGDKVEKSFKQYAEDLKAYHPLLKARLEKIAPDLLKKLDPEPPKVAEPSYQYLPVIEDRPLIPPPPKEKFQVTKFSWVGTGGWLESERKKLQEYLAALPTADATRLDELITQYQKLDKNQKIINSQIQYNRQWQAEIKNIPEKYAESTRLYEALVSKKIDPDKAVADRLDKTMGSPPDSIRLTKISPTHWALDVDLLTDIQDRAYVEKLKHAVEKFWRVKGKKRQYEVRLKFKQITPQELYQIPNPPMAGAKINVAAHVNLFPEGPIILTTGAGTTYYSVSDGRPYVVIGILTLAETTFAHEFGHLMTLNDAYFRGFKDLGKDGYEVLEVVPDLTDIMSAPDAGRVKEHHFEIVIREIQKREIQQLRAPASTSK